MTNLRNIIAISGSTRKQSSNLSLIRAISDLYAETIHIELFQGIADIPHFNPDMDKEHPPMEVLEFRRKLNSADGILICTPEYAMGVPGTLKNAIDWTVSSMEFSHKPVALITASSLGEKAHQSLLETLKIIESDITESSALLISFVKSKVRENQITDPKTLQQVHELMASFIHRMESRQRGS